MADIPDKEPAGPSKGTTHGGDQTAQPGQAAGGLFYGISNPLDTGAPGSGGAGINPDPTVQAPIPNSVYGAGTDDVHTGAPGTSGANGKSASGANYTVDTYGWYSWMDAGDGSVDTESQGNKYGSDTGIPGLYRPKKTGAGGGGIGHDHTGA